MPPKVTRRLMVSSISLSGLISLGGCLNASSNLSPGTLVLTNNHNQTHTVEVELSQGDKSQRDQFTLSSGEQKTVKEYVPYTGTYTYTATVDSGESETLEPIIETPNHPSGHIEGHIIEAFIGEEGVLTVAKTMPGGELLS